MSQTTDLNIDHVASLARLALTPEEKAKFTAQIEDILNYIAQLKEVNVDGIEPTAHAFPIYNVWADDIAVPGLPVEEALRNAPKTRDNMIVVPTVVE